MGKLYKRRQAGMEKVLRQQADLEPTHFNVNVLSRSMTSIHKSSISLLRP